MSFLTLAACNLGTDILLLVLPFPILLATKLNLRAYASHLLAAFDRQLTCCRTIQLSFLFGVGLLVIGITIARIPLILGDQMSQRSRSTVSSKKCPLPRYILLTTTAVGCDRNPLRLRCGEHGFLLRNHQRPSKEEGNRKCFHEQ